MTWLTKIGEHERKEYCQSGETGLLEYIFENIGTTDKFAVEFGGGDGYNLSNIRYFLENGWSGLQMDYDNKGNDEVKKEFITKDNIRNLFEKYGVNEQFDLLSIDLDGNDYWILHETLKEYSPRVIILEFNPAKSGSLAIEYNENHIWAEDNYYGATFEAFKKLCNNYGYKLIYNHRQLNLIFVDGFFLEEEPEVKWDLTYYHVPQKGNGKWIEV